MRKVVGGFGKKSCVSTGVRKPGNTVIYITDRHDMTLAVKVAVTLSHTTNFKLKEFADDNFKFYKNGRKFSKWVENNVGRGEIAHYEQFLLFPHCFQKACTADTKKPGLVWKRVKPQYNQSSKMHST